MKPPRGHTASYHTSNQHTQRGVVLTSDQGGAPASFLDGEGILRVLYVLYVCVWASPYAYNAQVAQRRSPVRVSAVRTPASAGSMQSTRSLYMLPCEEEHLMCRLT